MDQTFALEETKRRSRRAVRTRLPAPLAALIALVLYLPTLPFDALARETSDAELQSIQRTIKALERSGFTANTASRDGLLTIELEVRNNVAKKRKEFEEEGQRPWEEDLSVTQASSADVEALRKKLKGDLILWRDNMSATTLPELRKGLGEALVVAEADGLDIEKLKKVYDGTKEVIRSITFKDDIQSIPDVDMGVEVEGDMASGAYELGKDFIRELDHTLNNIDSNRLPARFVSLFTWAFDWHELLSKARAERQEKRVMLYKRATHAFIRALTSGKDEVAPCDLQNRELRTIDINGHKIPSFGCPDPVVENLQRFQDAVMKIKAADVDRLQVQIEMIIAEQQFVADLLSVVPVVGDSLDLNYVLTGRDINGIELSYFQRGLIGVFVALPVVGPGALKQAMKRWPALEENLIYLKEGLEWWMEAYYLMGRELASLGDEIGEAGSKALAKRLGLEDDALKKLYKMLGETDYVLDAAAKQRMSLWKTMRDAAEGKFDREAYERMMRDLPEEMAQEWNTYMNRLMRESKELVDARIIKPSGEYAERVARSNMVPSHVKHFEKAARERGEVYLFRPVGEDATDLLAKNIAGTKPLKVKPKSSDWSAGRGFIPVDQNFSKLGNPAGEINASVISKSQRYSDDLVESGMNTVHLKRTFDEFPGEKLETMIVQKGGREVPVYKRPDGSFIDPDTLKPIRSADVDTSKMRPFEVFADADGYPITADYDLLEVGRRGTLEAPTYRGAKGNITDSIEDSVDALNKAGRDAGYTKGDLVHHGPDTFNPATAGVDYRQAGGGLQPLHVTAFDPDYGFLTIPACDADCMKAWCRTTRSCDPTKICSGGKLLDCVLPDNDRLLKDYYQNLRMRGIDVQPHSAWGWGNYSALGGWGMTDYLDGAPATIIIPEGGAVYTKILEKVNKSLVGKAYYSFFGRQMRARGYYNVRCSGENTNCEFLN